MESSCGGAPDFSATVLNNKQRSLTLSFPDPAWTIRTDQGIKSLSNPLRKKIEESS